MDIILDPWNWWIQPFIDDENVRQALVAGILVILSASTIGTWVVIRGMSYFADALAHGVLPGVAIALMLNGNILVGAGIAALVMIAGIRAVRRFSPLPNDISIGLVFVGMLALTIVLLGGDEEREEELHELLFGNILEITGGDLLFQAIATGIILIGILLFYRALIATTFDATLSKLLSLRPELAEIVLLLLLGLSIVSSFKVAGSLLLFALLIAPPATSALLFRKTWAVMLGAIVQGIISTYLGILIGVHAETSLSGAVSLVSIGIFFLVLALRGVIRKNPKISLERL